MMTHRMAMLAATMAALAATTPEERAAAQFHRVVEPAKDFTTFIQGDCVLYNLDEARGKDKMPFHKRIDFFRQRAVKFHFPDDNGRPIECVVDPRTVRVEGPIITGDVHIRLRAEHVLARLNWPAVLQPQPEAAPAVVEGAGTVARNADDAGIVGG